MSCGDLNRKKSQRKEDICICIADSFCYTAETSTALQSNFGLFIRLAPIPQGLHHSHWDGERSLVFCVLLFWPLHLEYKTSFLSNPSQLHLYYPPSEKEINKNTSETTKKKKKTPNYSIIRLRKNFANSCV